MRLRDIQIGMGNIGTKGRFADPNREYVPDPCLSRIAFLKRITSDPLDRTYPAENSRQQIAHSKVFDLPVALRSPDRRTLQEAVTVYRCSTYRSRVRWCRFRRNSEHRR